MRKAIISTVALASVTSFALLHAGAPAAAKPMNSCQLKHSYCTERCIMKSDTYAQGNACIGRTCDHQMRNCMRNLGEGGGGGKVVRDHR